MFIFISHKVQNQKHSQIEFNLFTYREWHNNVPYLQCLIWREKKGSCCTHFAVKIVHILKTKKSNILEFY